MEKHFSDHEPIPSRAVKLNGCSQLSEKHTLTDRPRKRPRTGSHPLTEQADEKLQPENQFQPTCLLSELFLRRPRPSTPTTRKTIGEARIEFWSEKGSWPTEEQEKTMNRFQELRDDAHARKRSLSRKRSSTSLTSETSHPQASAGQRPQTPKSAPYNHAAFELQLEDCGSFMDDFAEGVTDKSAELCRTLLNEAQLPPEHTLFSDDVLFQKTCKRIQGGNESKVIRDITQLIVPSAEILADRGAKHLEILRETVNVCWVNSITFISPLSSRAGPRPQPDFGLGFKRKAFCQEQLQKLQPLLGDLFTGSSFIAATCDMYFPFFSAEVKCKASGLDIADRQNAHTQSVNLRGLHTLFRMVGREKELHREINGFSISHNDAEVRIWGHYAVISGDDIKYYRHLIRKFLFTDPDGRDKWAAYTFVRNLYDLWVPKHFERICDIINMLPVDKNAQISKHDQEFVSSRSGSSAVVSGT